MTEQVQDAFELCDLEELKTATRKGFIFKHPKYGKHEIAVFWDGNDVYALESSCPHEGGRLVYGFLEDRQIVCPLHYAVFDLKTGECLDKYTDDAEPYAVEVRDGRVWVIAPGEERVP